MKLPEDMAAFFVSCATVPAAETRREADLTENAALQALEWAEDPAIDLVSPPRAAAGSTDVRELLRTAGHQARKSLNAGPDAIEFLQRAAALLREAQRLQAAAHSADRPSRVGETARRPR